MMKKSKWLTSLAASFMLVCAPLASTASAVDINNKADLEKTIEQAMMNADGSLQITYTGSDVQSVYSNITSISMSVGNENDEILGILKSVSTSSSLKTVGGKPVSAQFNFTLDYFTTKVKKQQADAKLKSLGTSIKNQYKSEFDRVKAINEYLVLNTSYADASRYSGLTEDIYTSYGLLNNKLAVCQGYATAAYTMLKAAGLEVRYVVGDAYSKNGTGEAHAWNKVKIDGKWYNLDVTWNDPVPNRPNTVSYQYFLLSDKALNKDHVAANPDLYPAANDTRFDFLKDTSSVIINGNTLYYANDKQKQQLYAYDIKTKKHKRVANVRVQYLAYYKNKLYFSNYSNAGYLASINTNGKSLKILDKKFSTNIYIKGKKVYYTANGKNYSKTIK